MGIKKLFNKVKNKIKENKAKSEKDNEWKQSIKEEAKAEARVEAKEDLKKIYKEQEKKKILKGNNILEGLKELGNEFKTTGMGTDDKINRLLGKGGQQKQADGGIGFDSTNKINRVLGKGPSEGNFNVTSKILQDKQYGYADVIKDNKVVMTAADQKTKDKNERFARMLR
jgi:hypothetical protein